MRWGGGAAAEDPATARKQRHAIRKRFRIMCCMAASPAVFGKKVFAGPARRTTTEDPVRSEFENAFVSRASRPCSCAENTGETPVIRESSEARCEPNISFGNLLGHPEEARRRRIWRR